jgi:hypothetical protein
MVSWAAEEPAERMPCVRAPVGVRSEPALDQRNDFPLQEREVRRGLAGLLVEGTVNGRRVVTNTALTPQFMRVAHANQDDTFEGAGTHR